MVHVVKQEVDTFHHGPTLLPSGVGDIDTVCGILKHIRSSLVFYFLFTRAWSFPFPCGKKCRPNRDRGFVSVPFESNLESPTPSEPNADLLCGYYRLLKLETSAPTTTPRHSDPCSRINRPLLMRHRSVSRWSYRRGGRILRFLNGQDVPLSGLSPKCTRIATIYGSPRWELRVKDAKDGTILADLPLGGDDLGTGKVYDLTFDSETRFHLKIEGPGRHVQIPHDIIPSPSGPYSHSFNGHVRTVDFPVQPLHM
jgi:hypothetical protein